MPQSQDKSPSPGRQQAMQRVNEERAKDTEAAKEIFLEQLTKSRGIIATAAHLSGTNRRTVYRWMQEDVAFREQVEDTQALAVDRAEIALLRLIDDGDREAIKFYLRTKGKDRGYTYHDSMTLGSGESIQPPEIHLLPPDEPIQDAEAEEVPPNPDSEL